MRFLLIFSLLSSLAFGQQFEPYWSDGLVKVQYADLHATDIDSDGDLDLIISGLAGNNRCTQTYKNYGGSLSIFQGFLPPLAFGSISSADIDNDGDIDLFLTGSYGSGPYSGLLLNDGTGYFDEYSENLVTFTELSGSSSVFIDVNNDGHLDLFYSGRNSSYKEEAKLYINDGLGTFTEKTNNIIGLGHGSIETADYDNDGDSDLLISGESHDSIYKCFTKIYNNDGFGNFIEKEYNFVGIYSGQAKFIDIDSDLDLDVVVNGYRNSYGTYHSDFYLNDGSGNLISVGNRGLDSLLYNSIAIADIDLDGDSDILMSGRNKQKEDLINLYYNEQGYFYKDTNFISKSLSNGKVILFPIDDNCSADMVYCGFLKENCTTETFHAYNKNYTSECPTELEQDFDSTIVYSFLSNPFSRFLIINSDEIIIEVEIFDLTGKKIKNYQTNTKSVQIDLFDIQNGLYYINFTTNLNKVVLNKALKIDY